MRFRFLALLGFTLAISAKPLLASTPFRLFEIFAIRYIKDTSGATIQDRGVYNALGDFQHSIYAQLPPGTTVPEEAMNRPLLPFAVWPAYDALGQEALANFDLSQSILVNNAFFFVLTVAAQTKIAVGTVPNLSSRGTIAPGGEPRMGGFVVEDHPRRVLIRGIGPSLGNFGVAAPLANPVLTLYRQPAQIPIATNDDWNQQANASDIESAAVATGAFALPHNSKDAALVIELPPGVYAVQLGSADATGGSALLEIYILP